MEASVGPAIGSSGVSSAVGNVTDDSKSSEYVLLLSGCSGCCEFLGVNSGARPVRFP